MARNLNGKLIKPIKKTKNKPINKPKADLIGGLIVNNPGAAGSIYENFTLVFGDDFNARPTMYSGGNIGAKWASLSLTGLTRRLGLTSPNRMIYIESTYRGNRNQSPTDLGFDACSVANSILSITAQSTPAGLLPYMPTDYTQGNGDAQNKPLLISGGFRSWPSFMFSGKGNFIFEGKVKFPAGIARGFWPSLWAQCLNWPDYQEPDLVEGKKDGSGNVNSQANINGSLTDGGANSFVTLSDRAMPTNRFVSFVFKKVGTTVTIYDDATVEGTLAAVATYTDARVSRFRGAFDLRLEFAVDATWDASTYTAGDWPKTVDFDFVRAWVPTGTNLNTSMNVLPQSNIVAGGAWTYTIPDNNTLFGNTPDLIQITGAYDNEDTPGLATKTAERYPGGMTVDIGARTVTGNSPATDGGKVGLLFIGSYDAGGCARMAVKYWNIAPVNKNLFGNQTFSYAASVNLTIAYTDFHSGNLGPHIYTVTKTGGSWLTITGSGTTSATISGTAPGSDDSFSIDVTCTNSIGQATTVSRTVTVSAAGYAYTSWSGVGWFDISDNSTLTLSGSEVTAIANKRTGKGDLTGAGTGSGRVLTTAGQNGLDVITVTRDIVTPPRFEAPFDSLLSQAFQGNDKPYTNIWVYKPTDANSGYVWSASDTVDATDAQAILFVRGIASCTSRRRLITAQGNDVTFGSGHASGTARVVAFKYDGNAITVWDNSATTKIVNATAQNVNAFNTELVYRLFAAEGPGASDPTIILTGFSMTFCENVVEDTAKSDADIQQAITDLASKWGITLS